jgi:hypothetical protein
MPFLTVSSGGASDVDEGVYEVVLTDISEPKTVLAARGPKAGQEIQLLDWTFAIVGGKHDSKELQTSTSTASGPKSKMYAYLTALLGGKPPVIGQAFEKTDLVGRMALATVAIDEGGWPRVANLGALPASLLSQHVAKATGAPIAANAPGTRSLNLQPAAVPLAVADRPADDLPF